MNNTVTLSQSVMKRLEKISTSSRLTPQFIISEAIDDRLDYEEWALEQIDAGLADIKTGRVLSDDEFWKQINTRHEAIKAA
jgi:predicted transcriptional regulator